MLRVKIEVNGQPVVEGDLVELLLMKHFQGVVDFHPPEKSVVSVSSWVPGGGSVGTTYVMRYEGDDE